MSWPLVKLSELCEINIGKTPARAKAAYWGKGNPWLSIRDMNQGLELRTTKEEITDLGVRESCIKLVSKGTVLFSFKLSIGKIGIAQRDMYTNEAIAALPIKDKTQLCEEYLVYALTKIDAAKSTDRAVMGATLNKKKLAELKIPLPPLEEQKRIAAILDKADAIRRKRRQTIDFTDQLLHSIFLDMFGDPVTNPEGWPEEILVNLISCNLQNGAYYPKEEYSDNGIEMVHMSDAFYDVIQRGKLKRVLASETDIEKYKLTSEDLLISRRSLTYEGAAKPCLIPPSSEPLIFESSMIRVTPDTEKVLTRYLFEYLSHPTVKTHFIRKYVTGATIKGISQKNLENIRVLIPPIDIQRKFLATADKLNSKVEVYEKHMLLLEQLQGSLTQQAFNGKLSNHIKAA